MNEKEQAILYDLLTTKAIYGLDEAEQLQLERLDAGSAEMEFRSLEMTAAAIALADIDVQPLPVHLRAKLDEAAGVHFAESQTIAAEPWIRSTPAVQAPVEDGRGINWFGWLGWAAAAAAVVALAVNLYVYRPVKAPEIARAPQDRQVIQPPSAAQMRDELVKTATDVLRASWAAGNVKGLTDLKGDLVWSDQKQSGYMTFKGLPPNDPNQYTYQLWIMDETQDKATPIDGGTFDVNSGGEVVIPITPKLKAKSPDMFAVTMEKPGGVVVSKRERIAAIAKVETRSAPNS